MQAHNAAIGKTMTIAAEFALVEKSSDVPPPHTF
jgi:hypothetical protein